jgi:superfamily II DNA/RNA helicase
MPQLVVDSLSDDQSGNPGSLRATLLRAAFLVTTPGIIAGALERHLVGSEYISSVRFVIVDEFDTFVVSDETEYETEARFARNWARLKAQLRPSTRYLVKSATLNLTDKREGTLQQTRTTQRARHISEMLSPTVIEIAESEYANVLPFQNIIEVDRRDENIVDLVTAVSTSKGVLHAILEDVAGPINYDIVERTAPHICDGSMELPRRYQELAPGQKREIRQLHCGTTALKMMPQHIFEDLTRHLHVKSQSARIKTRENEIVFIKDAILLDDARENGRFEFSPGAKTEALEHILVRNKQKKRRTVAFCRTIRLLDALKKRLEPLKLAIFELTGEMRDADRATAIKGLRKSEDGVLLMTRTTGGRGLDLPFVECGLFYSPKTDPVQMWQEMSRIRSTVSTPKDTYVLCYGGTQEPEILRVVVTELAARNLRTTLKPNETIDARVRRRGGLKRRNT